MQFRGKEEITYLLVNVHDVKEVCGAEWKNTERGTVIYPKCDIVEIVFRNKEQHEKAEILIREISAFLIENNK